MKINGSSPGGAGARRDPPQAFRAVRRSPGDVSIDDAYLGHLAQRHADQERVRWIVDWVILAFAVLLLLVVMVAA